MKRKAESTTNGNPEGMQMRTLAATWRQVLLPMVAGESLKTARKRLAQIVSWLERNGEEDAAASLREGLEETLTIWKLALPPRCVASSRRPTPSKTCSVLSDG